MTNYILEYSDVYLRYDNMEKPALEGVSFGVKKGEFITILGNSGSGKTTLIKLANRLLIPSEGAVLYKNRDISEMDIFELRRNMGYVIQSIGLYPHMTVEDNIAVTMRILKSGRDERSSRVRELLEIAKLPLGDEFLKRHPWQLSGGQQQRVGLARALCANPEILIMDEPFGALDVLTRKELQNEIVDIQKRFNKTILFVTHDLKEALALGDRVLVLNRGVIQQFDRPKELVFNPGNEYVAGLLEADTLVRKLQFFRVSDFNELIRPSGQDGYMAVQFSDSMETVTNHLLMGERYLSVFDGDRHIGNIDCEQLRNLEE